MECAKFLDKDSKFLLNPVHPNKISYPTKLDICNPKKVSKLPTQVVSINNGSYIKIHF